MSPISRRSLLSAAAAAGAAAQFSWALGSTTAQAAPRQAAAGPEPVTLKWLEDDGLGAAPGTTLGVPWPKGAYAKDQTFSLTTADGRQVPVQSWPLAQWPDGSLKWTAHAIGPETSAKSFTLTAGEPAAPARRITVTTKGARSTSPRASSPPASARAGPPSSGP